MAQRHEILAGTRWTATAEEQAVTNPYDGSTVGVTYLAGPTELETAAAAAAASFEALKAMASYERAEAIGRVADSIGHMAEELAATICAEAGKPIKDARGEVKRAQNTFRIASEEAKRLGGEVLPLDIMPGSEGRFALVRRFPVGVVLGITPFNFPLNLVAHKAAPAMACGCPIIIKPAPKTPITALMLARIISDAGWPAGALSVVPCSNENAQRLFLDERVKMLSFTGSAKVGWMLKSMAGRRKVTLELGGNAGAIVHDDADVEAAAKRCALGAFSYAGQICISVQRVYIHRSVLERFKEAFLACRAGLICGDPSDPATDIGPMIDEAAAIRTEGWVEEAVEQGAVVLAGGGRRASFFEPTVLAGTSPSMKVCGEEVFAPLVNIEPYDTFEEAVGLVNAGLYGLQAGVFTRDMGRILHAYERLDVGGVVVGDIPTYRTDNMPYGGVKMSGAGREGIRYAIEEMTEMKLLAVKA
ncbi:MAG: aldehyde dehydrogenase family protein [Thermodesulfobacteriota bacterium]